MFIQREKDNNKIKCLQQLNITRLWLKNLNNKILLRQQTLNVKQTDKPEESWKQPSSECLFRLRERPEIFSCTKSAPFLSKISKASVENYFFVNLINTKLWKKAICDLWSRVENGTNVMCNVNQNDKNFS